MSWVKSLLFRDVVFTMDWEDPTTQDRALGVAPGDVALTITAGGCNALNMVLASPAKLYCVDGNAAQTRLLELKIAAAAGLDHEAFFDIFAARAPARIREVYPAKIRPRLSLEAQRFWDRRLGIVAANIYHAGRIGLYLRLLRAGLRVLRLGPERVAELLDAEDLAAQRRWYAAHLERRLWSPLSRRFVRSKLLNYLSGMHPEQLARIEREGGFDNATLGRLERVIVDVPIRDNYFVAMAATGAFRGERVPPYLRRENFDQLRTNLDRIEPITSWLDPVLDRLPAGSLHKLNLLDIFDWMTPDQVEATMQRVARVAAPGAVLLYRAAPMRLDPPASVLQFFALDRTLSERLLLEERSTIHGSLYVMRRRTAD